MFAVVGMAILAVLQESDWNSDLSDHRLGMIGMFVFGAAVVALLVVGRRLFRRDKPANGKILE